MQRKGGCKGDMMRGKKQTEDKNEGEERGRRQATENEIEQGKETRRKRNNEGNGR